MLCRRALPEHPSHRLDYLRDNHGLTCSRPHSALGDVESVTDLLTRIVFPRLAAIGFDSIEAVREFAAMRPVLRCKCLIQGIDYQEEERKVLELRKQARAERRKAEKEWRQVWLFLLDVECGRYPLPDLIVEHELIDEEPNIQFFNRTFLFTGKMAWGTRPQAAERIEERGGIVSQAKTVTENIDYLVLGEDKDHGWTSLIHGGKLTHAFLRRFREPDSRFRIVREEAFVAALGASQPTGLLP